MFRTWREGSGKAMTAEINRCRRDRDPLALPMAIYGLVHPDDEASAASARLLANDPAEGARTVFVRLRDAIGDQGRGKDAIAWLRRSASDKSSTLRLRTARDLGWMPLPEAEDILAGLMRDKSRQVRQAAAISAGHVCRTDKAREALTGLVRHSDEATSRTAREALREFDERLAPAPKKPPAGR